MQEEHTKLLLACGAAGGIAATFNAPLAGVVFGQELILRRWTSRTFGYLALASVTACAIARAVFGDRPFLVLEAMRVGQPGQYLLFAALGVLAGTVGIGFTRFLYVAEDVCDRLWRGPEWLRPAVGGLLLGLILLALPQMYGVGYPVLEGAVHGKYALGLLLLLMFGKTLATSTTMGIGGSGGVFAPSLFIGATLGAAFGLLVSPANGPAFALVGMAAVFAGSARAPITAVVIMVELTGEYTLIAPFMLAVATGVSRLLSRDTVYTLKLTRRGIDLAAQGAERLGLRGGAVAAWGSGGARQSSVLSVRAGPSRALPSVASLRDGLRPPLTDRPTPKRHKTSGIPPRNGREGGVGRSGLVGYLRAASRRSSAHGPGRTVTSAGTDARGDRDIQGRAPEHPSRDVEIRDRSLRTPTRLTGCPAIDLGCLGTCGRPRELSGV